MTKYQFYYLIGLYVYINLFATIRLIQSESTWKSKVIAIIVLFSLPFLGYYLVARQDKKERKMLSAQKVGIFITAIIFYGFIFLLLGSYRA